MSDTSRALRPSLVATFVALATLFVAPACDDAARKSSGSDATEPGVAVKDATLSPAAERALDAAFRAASAFPTDPHARNRARAQYDVARACLELELPNRALKYGARIDDWRKGLVLAECALFLAERGAADDVKRLSAEAERAATAESNDPDSQEWRADRVRATLAAAAHALKSGAATTTAAEKDLVASERPTVVAARAARATPETFDATLAELVAIGSDGGFDNARATVAGCVELFDVHFARVDLRDRAEAALKEAGSKIPVGPRFEALEALVRAAAKHGDFAKAKTLADEAAALFDGSRWTHEDRVAFGARVARLYGLSKAAPDALKRLDAAEAEFATRRKAIVDIYRAQALAAVAAAARSLGDDPRAARLFGDALTDAFVNPNARPRAQDLVAICLSMVSTGFEPDSALLERVDGLVRRLGPPW